MLTPKAAYLLPRELEEPLLLLLLPRELDPLERDPDELELLEELLPRYVLPDELLERREDVLRDDDGR
jgi:hypothetical protein